jgi:AbrB family looped-hinge helix DNA binding protein
VSSALLVASRRLFVPEEISLCQMKLEMTEEITIGRRFSVVIPKKIREKIKLKEGQTAIITTEDGRVIMEPLPENPYQILAEALGNINYREKKHEKKAEEWLRRVARPRH